MTTREDLQRRFHDPAVQPEGYVAMRCTDHGRFVVWVWPPLPDSRIACPPECARSCPRCSSRNAADLGNGYFECFGCGHGWSPAV